ncbi:MAG: S46 family peptidase [Flavobacteriales bacterium]|nr:S46 family peptidase [Flavobacteriales bacterium]
MMKKLLLTLFVGLCFLGRSDEGMYMPFMLKQNYKDMKAAGLELSYKKIYNEKKPSVKDAIVSLGGFCTAEIISPKGLMLTNHHCGYDAIRANSTPENDYLTDGFWAMNNGEELPIEGLTASIVVRIEDVTEEVLAVVDEHLVGMERYQRIQQVAGEIEKAAVQGTHYEAKVKPFFGGSEFYLFITEVFTDVRLVGAPPSSIGKYGGDTDNWMWTRHTGDFSMFRIYANAENKPAPFSMENRPYVPKHHLPVSTKGVEKGDFSMVMGYPGSTDRYLTSEGVNLAIQKDQPTRVEIRGKKLHIMKEEMDKSDAVRIQYASTYAQVSNYWKYFIGQSEQLKNNKVYDKKVTIEKGFESWVAEDDSRKERYGTVIQDLKDAYKVIDEVTYTRVCFYEAYYSIALNRFIIAHAKLKKLLEEEAPQEEINAEAEGLKAKYQDFFEGFNYAIEEKTMAEMFKVMAHYIPEDQRSEKLNKIASDSKFDFEAYVTKNLKNSVFSSKERYDEFISNPTKAQIENEELLSFGIELLAKYREVNSSAEVAQANAKKTKANRLFIEALRKMNPKKKYYPNANSTLRLSYGNVMDYTNNEGKAYKYYTTIDGLMAKEDPNNPEFIVPARLKELYEKKDYGQYAAQDGNLWVNFISNNDITGGNSGSPVMNANGELIGCAFDGNWEAMSGDIAFEDNLQRTISVDIRYILFVIDKYAGASHLIDEMTLVE